MGCHSAGIEVLQTSIIQYAELPKEVKKVMFLKNYTEQDGSISQKAFTELNEDSKYEYFDRQNSIMPWVYESEILRKSDDKRFILNLSLIHI